ncbi:MAG: tail fiber domain-containing protein [Pedobacter sp.]|nr:tail fiber domain-containing protein [Pedobacter sp.]
MKKLITILLIAFAFGANAQSYQTTTAATFTNGTGKDVKFRIGTYTFGVSDSIRNNIRDSLLKIPAYAKSLTGFSVIKASTDPLYKAIGYTPSYAEVIAAIGFTPENLANKGAANGYASLDGSTKIPISQLPDAIVGSVNYQGGYNASTNTPTLPTATGNKGKYYVVSVAGTQVSLVLNVGDWIISNGTIWQKVDNNNTVTSVAGKVGAVSLVIADIGGLVADLTGKANLSGANFTGPVSLTSTSDQYFRSDNTYLARKGLWLSDNSTVNMKIYTGGSATLGAYTESVNTLVIGTGIGGGGGSAEKILFHSTGRGNMFVIDAANQLNTSFFPLVATSFSVPGGTSPQFLKANGTLDNNSYELSFAKNTGFNKNFGTASGTVAQGNDSRINNGQTAFSSLSNYALLSGANFTGAITSSSSAQFGSYINTSDSYVIKGWTTLRTSPATADILQIGGVLTSQWYFLDFYANGVGSMRLNSTSLSVYGDIIATGNVTAYSSEKLKDNIKPIDGTYALKAIKNIRAATYTWNGKDVASKKGTTGIGVIAEDVNKYFPDLVNKDNEYWAVAYGNISAVLMAAIKEQQKQIEDLTKEVKKLKRKQR